MMLLVKCTAGHDFNRQRRRACFFALSEPTFFIKVEGGGMWEYALACFLETPGSRQR